MAKKPKAEAQFAALGIAPADYTPAMTLAVTQKWTGLPVDEKVESLRARIAAVKPVEVPAVEELVAGNLTATGIMDRDGAEKEHARLKRNAGVAAWRERKQLQAALDARDLKFAALRAKRAAPAPVVAPS